MKRHRKSECNPVPGGGDAKTSPFSSFCSLFPLDKGIPRRRDRVTRLLDAHRKKRARGSSTLHASRTPNFLFKMVKVIIRCHEKEKKMRAKTKRERQTENARFEEGKLISSTVFDLVGGQHRDQHSLGCT
jgi:hypothetical protein